MDAKPKKRDLTPAAERALKEAEERRAERARPRKRPPPRSMGRRDPIPARYGDWEKDGIASDF